MSDDMKDLLLVLGVFAAGMICGVGAAVIAAIWLQLRVVW